MPIKNGCVKLPDGDLDYVSFGNGAKKLIVLPGLSDGLATVKGKALLLQGPYRRYLDRYTVYLFSRRNPLPTEYSIRQMAGDQALALQKLGIEKTAVLGVSQGGMVAQYLAIDHPELVEKLVLAVTAPKANAVLQSCVPKWMECAKGGNHKELMTDTAEKSYTPQRLMGYRLMYPLMGMIGKPKDYRRFLTNAHAIMTFDASAELGRIKAPTLIIGGSEDQIVGVQASYELNEGIAGSELWIYQGLGHALYEEAKDFYQRVFQYCDA